MLAHEVLLLLGQIAEVVGGAADEDLARGQGLALAERGAGREHAERFDGGAAGDGSAHTNEGVILDGACVETAVSADVDIVADADGVDLLTGRLGADPGQILNCGILADGDLGGVAPNGDSMPEGAAFSEGNVTDNSGVGSNPIALNMVD